MNAGGQTPFPERLVEQPGHELKLAARAANLGEYQTYFLRGQDDGQALRRNLDELALAYSGTWRWE